MGPALRYVLARCGCLWVVCVFLYLYLCRYVCFSLCAALVVVYRFLERASSMFALPRNQSLFLVRFRFARWHCVTHLCVCMCRWPGFPYCYGYDLVDDHFNHQGNCDNYTGAALELQPHAAALGVCSSAWALCVRVYGILEREGKLACSTRMKCNEHVCNFVVLMVVLCLCACVCVCGGVAGPLLRWQRVPVHVPRPCLHCRTRLVEPPATGRLPGHRG